MRKSCQIFITDNRCFFNDLLVNNHKLNNKLHHSCANRMLLKHNHGAVVEKKIELVLFYSQFSSLFFQAKWDIICESNSIVGFIYLSSINSSGW